MRAERLATLEQHGIAYDCETHPIQPGLVIPPLVCGSIANATGGELLDKERALQTARAILERPHLTMITANGPFDLLVLANEWRKRGFDILPLIFQALEEGRIYDVLTAQALDAVAGGHLGDDPRTGRQLRDVQTGKPCRYNLGVVTELLSGRKDAKGNDEYRERYHELDGIPLEQWPAVARQYPVDDVNNTYDDALRQVGLRPRMLEHDWADDKCRRCGAELGFGRVPDCVGHQPLRNLHDLADQVYSHWALALGAAWGFRTDGPALDELEREAKEGQDANAHRFIWLGPDGKHAGILRPAPDGYSQSLSTTKRLIALAYGCTLICQDCLGTGKVPSSKQPQVKCKKCPGIGCIVCNGVGFVNSPKRTNEINCETCDATGLVLIDAVPRSDGGGVAYGRPTLNESGDELLMAFADYSEDKKIRDVYVPYLRRGVDRPLTLYPNVLLKSGRVSYLDAIMLLPREGGVRRCVVSR